MTDAVVVGGGLAGLVAARHLAADGRDVTLLEHEPVLGGRVRTDHEDGFTLDRGFQVLFPSYPAVEAELDLEALDLHSFSPGAILARPGKRSTLADPFRDPGSFTETLLNREVTLGDKLRILRLRRKLSGKSVGTILDDDNRTIARYLADQGFSQAFREHFVAPFYGGITLDRSLSASQLVFEYTFKMLIESEAALPADGMGAIPAQLAATARDAGVTIETDTRVTALHTDGDDGVQIETRGETIDTGSAVVATDPRTAQELTDVTPIPTDARACVTQYFSLPRSQRLDTGGRLVLNVADDRPNQVAPLSDAVPSYAPDGTHLLSATFLGEQDESDEALVATVREALAMWYPENSFAELDLLRTDRIGFAQFAQPPGFRGRLPAVDAPEGPVVLAGDYTSWSSIQGAMASGRRAARALSTD